MSEHNEAVILFGSGGSIYRIPVYWGENFRALDVLGSEANVEDLGVSARLSQPERERR